jgi:hypothetical protein
MGDRIDLVLRTEHGPGVAAPERGKGVQRAPDCETTPNIDPIEIHIDQSLMTPIGARTPRRFTPLLPFSTRRLRLTSTGAIFSMRFSSFQRSIWYLTSCTSTNWRLGSAKPCYLAG